MSQTTLTIAALNQIVTEIFLNAGLSAQQAEAVAAVIVAGERDGCRSRGICRIDGNLRTLAAGKVQPQAVPQLNNDDSGVMQDDGAWRLSRPRPSHGRADAGRTREKAGHRRRHGHR